MGTLDTFLSQAGSNLDVKGIAQRVGLPPEKVEAAISALATAQNQPGDTVQTAANSSGVPADKLTEIVNQIGGEGALTKISSFIGQKGGASGLFRT